MKSILIASLAFYSHVETKRNKNKKPKLPVSKFTFTNARFDDGGNVSNYDGDCVAGLAIDGDAPPDHYDKYQEAGYDSMWTYYNANQAGPCNGAAQGNKGASLLLEIEESVEGVTSFEAWPGIGWWFGDPFYKLSSVEVCENADYTSCSSCKRKTTPKCGKKFLGCSPNGYPYTNGGKAPISYKCKKSAKGKYVKVIVPPAPGKKWGAANQDYAQFGLIEISGFGYITPDPIVTCQCENGNGVEGDECPSSETYKCAACNPGYHLNQENNLCEENLCNCDNGAGASGLSCPKKNDNKCASCNPGFYLKNNNCKRSNRSCLLKMFNSLESNENLFVDVSWEDDSYIKVATRPSVDNSNMKLAKFKDLTINSFTVETGFVDYLDANIGWIPSEKQCAPDEKPFVDLWEPGSCWDYETGRGDDSYKPYYASSNSGVGRQTGNRWSYEGRDLVMKKGPWWKNDRWLVKANLDRTTVFNPVWPVVSVQFLDGPEEDELGTEVFKIKGKTTKYLETYIEWDTLVPAVGIAKSAGDEAELRIVDAECE